MPGVGQAIAIEQVTGLDDARAEWSALAAASGNVFLTWEWLSSWFDAFGERWEPALRLCRRADGSPLALLPLCRDRRRTRLLRFMGHPVSDLLGSVCAPEDRPTAMAAMRDVLAESDAQAFATGPVAVAEDWRGGLGGAVVQRLSSPTLAFEGRSWEEILSERSSNFRGQMRRIERRLARAHRVDWRLCDATTLERDLETLFSLHHARWQGASKAFEGQWATLHRRFAGLALERGWLRLTVLELDGKPAAASYNFRFGKAESFYQGGRDPAFDDLRVGLALQIQAIRAALEDGLEEYRFLRGDEPYKRRFANRDDAVESVLVPLRVGGIALARTLPVAPRMGPVGERLVRALS